MRDSAKRERARELRRDMTLAERRLWQVLKGRGLEGHRFRRQHPMGPFIADFACLEAGIVIEVDGGQHQDNDDDRCRDRYLRGIGFKVLRFWNNDVLANPEGVRAVIAQALAERCPHPQPSSASGARHASRRLK
ncbi:MAG: endonuclease domain-containing protein [Pseudoxanthomonas sp.]